MDASAQMRYRGNIEARNLLAVLAVMGITPTTGGPLGLRKDGSLIWPIAGADGESLDARIATLSDNILQLAKVREETAVTGKAADSTRNAEALDATNKIAAQLAELNTLRNEQKANEATAARKAEIDDAVKAALSAIRGPSMAGAIAGNGSRPSFEERGMKASPILREAFGDGYVPGTFMRALSAYKGYLSDGIDIETINAGKAKLAELGLVWLGSPENAGKATLGTTGATGGYVLPNNLVDSVVKPNTQSAVYRNLVTIVPGVAVRGVDQPYRLGAPTRMTSQDWGATKENLNESYGSYTASLVTFARVYDVGKQYLRFSAGSAERDVLDELTKAADLAENFEIIAGPGTGSVGSGDACNGVYTSLNATPSWIGYKGAFSSASNSTVAGSLASACANLMGSLAGRNRTPSAIVVDSTTYFTALAQGSDTAGFWVDPSGGPLGFTRTQSGGIAFWGIPIFYDTNLGTNASTKIAIAAEWDAFKLYRGMEFRIDSSDVAGTRWDQNLVGFRGEMELGFNADTAVHVGAAQLLTAVIP
jgi:HK97 family phage major capsid protein